MNEKQKMEFDAAAHYGPGAVRAQMRICFGIVWFDSEENARRYAKKVMKQGRTYNGGFYDGRPCGRNSNFDYDDEVLGKLYAVTH